MMIITSNLSLRRWEWGGGGNELLQFKTTTSKKKNRTKLIEKFNRSCLAPMNKGLLYLEDYLQRLPTLLLLFFFCTTLCEWENQIVESVIVVFLLSQLKLTWLQEKVTVTYNINLAFLRRAKTFGGPKLEGRLTYLGPRFRLFVALTSLPEMNDHSHKWIPA